MNIGFIGLGSMGSHMAASLQRAGHALAVNDIRHAAASTHLAAGATWAGSPIEVAQASEVVFTSLPGPLEVESVALGASGLLHSMRPGSVYIDLSTNSPSLMRHLYQLFSERHIAVLDAPVSGGPQGARTRKLAVWVGGDEDVYTRCRPLLEAIGDQVVRVGPIGAGLVAKLVHNCAGYTIQCALAEVFSLGVKAGVEPLALWQAVRQGALGRQRTFDRLADHFLSASFDPPAFALQLAHKDMSLATGLGREHHVPMRLASLALEELTEALNRGWGQRDSRVAMLLQEERSGVHIQVEDASLRATLEAD